MMDPDTAPESDPCSVCRGSPKGDHNVQIGSPKGDRPVEVSRRAVLRGVASAGAGAVSVSLLAALPGGCMQGNAAPAGPVAAGNVADIAVGSLNLVAGENVILGRDDRGFYAMTRVCTHQGQLVSVVSVAGAPALHCPAHGSEFSMNGAVTHGPAARALEHFMVEIAADGAITIQGGQAVTADWRAPAA